MEKEIIFVKVPAKDIEIYEFIYKNSPIGITLSDYMKLCKDRAADEHRQPPKMSGFRKKVEKMGYCSKRSKTSREWIKRPGTENMEFIPQPIVGYEDEYDSDTSSTTDGFTTDSSTYTSQNDLPKDKSSNDDKPNTCKPGDDKVNSTKKSPKFKKIIQSYLYLITEEPYSDTVKIGFSCDPEVRLRELQTGNPRKLVIKKCYLLNNAQAVEKSLHDNFITRRIRPNGEWFTLNENELSVLIFTLNSSAAEPPIGKEIKDE